MKTLIINPQYFDNQYSIAQYVQDLHPNIVLLGHSNVALAHPMMMEIAQTIKSLSQNIVVIYGGSFASTHFVEIFKYESCIDYIVRENRSIKTLLNAIKNQSDLSQVKGIVYRDNGALVITPNALANEAYTLRSPVQKQVIFKDERIRA